jgi:hypothetical protein
MSLLLQSRGAPEFYLNNAVLSKWAYYKESEQLCAEEILLSNSSPKEPLVNNRQTQKGDIQGHSLNNITCQTEPVVKDLKV